MTTRLRPCALFLATMFSLSAAGAQAGYMVGTWGASPMAAAPGDAGRADQTLREVVHISLAGTHTVSVTLTNEFGTEPLQIGAATIALRSDAGTVQTPVALTFAGAASVTIPPGSARTSDPALLSLPAFSDIAVSLFIPAQIISTVTQHGFANATSYIAPGNQAAATALTDAKPMTSWRFLSEIDVDATLENTVICLGDSITDGSKSSRDANLRWPDLLAARLAANPKTAKLGVLNEGIGGNRILHDVTGPSAIQREDRDVFGIHPGVLTGTARQAKYLIILEGINDIGHAADPAKPYDIVNADELIAAYRLLIVRAHAHSLKVFGATLTPYVGAKYSSPQGEQIRQALNAWIRTTRDLDGVIDFDKATTDPAHPGMFLPQYDSGDHLHPNDAGMHAMADSINLHLFEK